MFATKAYIQDLVVEKLNATIADIEILNAKQADLKNALAQELTTGRLSVGFINGGSPITSANMEGYLTWDNISNKPSFRTVSFIDREGNVIHAYGP